MKKITILVDQFNQHGGIEKLVAIKANYWLSQFNYAITIVSTENKNKDFVYDLDPGIRFIDLKINYNRLISYFSLKNLLRLLLNIYKIQTYIIKEKPEFVIVASHIPITYVLPFLVRRKTKIVKEFHFTKFFYERNKKSIKQGILNYIEGKYNQLVVLSSEERLFYKSDNVVIIPNPITSNAKISQTPILEKDFIASTIVRFARVKRLEHLIKIWEEFLKTDPKWKLNIYGPLDNEYSDEIQKIVKKRKLIDSIIFKGGTDNGLKEIAKSRVVLITSEQECFPMLLLEANSVGVPVISYNCPTGPRNIIHDNIDGFLVENSNINSFVSFLQKFSNDDELQKKFSKNALVNADNYNLESIMNLWKNKIFLN